METFLFFIIRTTNRWRFMGNLRCTRMIMKTIASVCFRAFCSPSLYLTPEQQNLQRTESAAFALHRWTGDRTVLRGRSNPRLVRSIPISTRGCNPYCWLPWKLSRFSIHVQVSILYTRSGCPIKGGTLDFRYFEMWNSSIFLFHQIKHCQKTMLYLMKSKLCYIFENESNENRAFRFLGDTGIKGELYRVHHLCRPL